MGETNKNFKNTIFNTLNKLVPSGSKFPVSGLPIIVDIEDCDEEKGSATIRIGECEFEEASRYVLRLKLYLESKIPKLNNVVFSITERDSYKIENTSQNSTDTISFTVDAHESPAVFISYRWGENDKWVDKYVSDLSSKGIGVVYDRWLYEKWKGDDIGLFVQSLLNSMNQCHAFMPIFTPEYIKRAGFLKGKSIKGTHPDDGVVFDEFEHSILLSQYKRIETIAVLLKGTAGDLPEPFNENNILDMRDSGLYEAQVQRVALYLHNCRAVKNRGPYHGTAQGNDIWFKDEWSTR